MKKVTIIVGPQSSGKTTLAKQMTEGRKAVFVDPSNIGPFLFSEVKADTEVIVMEEVYSVSQYRIIAGSNKIMINKQGLTPVEIDTPDLIFTSNFLTRNDIEPIPCLYYNFIELTKIQSTK